MTLKEYLSQNKHKTFMEITFLYEDIIIAVQSLSPPLLDEEIEDPILLKNLIEKGLKSLMFPDAPDWEQVTVGVIDNFIQEQKGG